jgi:hypothetical protein
MPPAIPSSATVNTDKILFATDLHEPLSTAIDAAYTAGTLPSLKSVFDLVLPFVRSNVAAPPIDIHTYITGLFPPAHRVLAETVAMSIHEVAKDNAVLNDVIHRLRLDVMNRDRQIQELTARLQPAARASTSSACLDVCSSDREFD